MSAFRVEADKIGERLNVAIGEDSKGPFTRKRTNTDFVNNFADL